MSCAGLAERFRHKAPNGSPMKRPRLNCSMILPMLSCFVLLWAGRGRTNAASNFFTWFDKLMKDTPFKASPPPPQIKHNYTTYAIHPYPGILQPWEKNIAVGQTVGGLGTGLIGGLPRGLVFIHKLTLLRLSKLLSQKKKA